MKAIPKRRRILARDKSIIRKGSRLGKRWIHMPVRLFKKIEVKQVRLSATVDIALGEVIYWEEEFPEVMGVDREDAEMQEAA